MHVNEILLQDLFISSLLHVDTSPWFTIQFKSPLETLSQTKASTRSCILTHPSRSLSINKLAFTRLRTHVYVLSRASPKVETFLNNFRPHPCLTRSSISISESSGNKPQCRKIALSSSFLTYS
ncbi:hypothetical protein HanRHA438_Chr02g0095061 [Helianthus annuus]|nr:hypothetical protein HanRHA438_Chr02g0095061 [Helianthus annuus]